mmetsp:Transcript_15712/g.38243  ORF Transcript_15712/g.38243 Transcript_15712/m.38243 type:complete len:396 (+) Transcript_15712:1147-2334(+)
MLLGSTRSALKRATSSAPAAVDDPVGPHSDPASPPSSSTSRPAARLLSLRQRLAWTVRGCRSPKSSTRVSYSICAHWSASCTLLRLLCVKAIIVTALTVSGCISPYSLSQISYVSSKSSKAFRWCATAPSSPPSRNPFFMALARVKYWIPSTKTHRPLPSGSGASRRTTRLSSSLSASSDWRIASNAVVLHPPLPASVAKLSAFQKHAVSSSSVPCCTVRPRSDSSAMDANSDACSISGPLYSEAAAPHRLKSSAIMQHEMAYSNSPRARAFSISAASSSLASSYFPVSCMRRTADRHENPIESCSRSSTALNSGCARPPISSSTAIELVPPSVTGLGFPLYCALAVSDTESKERERELEFCAGATVLRFASDSVLLNSSRHDVLLCLRTSGPRS